MLTQDGAVVIDSMPFPSETRQVLSFVEGELGPNSVRYLINTHHHADHVYGDFLYSGAEVIGHELITHHEPLGQSDRDRAGLPLGCSVHDHLILSASRTWDGE